MQVIGSNLRKAGSGRVVMLGLLTVLVIGVALFRMLRPGTGGIGAPERAPAVVRDGRGERDRRAFQLLGWRHRFGLSQTNAEASAEAVPSGGILEVRAAGGETVIAQETARAAADRWAHPGRGGGYVGYLRAWDQTRLSGPSWSRLHAGWRCALRMASAVAGGWACRISGVADRGGLGLGRPSVCRDPGRPCAGGESRAGDAGCCWDRIGGVASAEETAGDGTERLNRDSGPGLALLGGPERPMEPWEAHSKTWDRLGSPFRPLAEDVSRLEQGWRESLDRPDVSVPVQILMLGVTPELAGHRWAPEFHLTALDASGPMIRNVWPGDSVRRRVVEGNWLELPFREACFDVVLTDCGLTALGLPGQIERLGWEVRRVLRAGGRFVFRHLAGSAIDARAGGGIPRGLDDSVGGFHAFKLRFLHALDAESRRGGVLLKEAWERFQAEHRDREASLQARRAGFQRTAS